MPFNLTTTAKAIAKSVLGERKFNELQIYRARTMLAAIEKVRGKTPRTDIRRSHEYAVDVLGSRHFAPWLYVYCAMAGRFKEGWIPENYFGAVVLPKVEGHYGIVSSLKPMNSLFFRSQAFPDLLSQVNGLFVDTDYKQVPAAKVKERLFRGGEQVVFKGDGSLGGRQIRFIDRESFDVEKVAGFGNGLFQAFIRQHPVFERLYPDAVATLRLVTVYADDGTASLRAAYLRLGDRGDRHVVSNHELKVPVDVQTGSFADHAYTQEWSEIAAHPTTKATFAGNAIPAFKECVSTVVELQKKVPYIRCIGWDLSVDADEKPRIMEWNGYFPGIRFPEAMQGPCFADLGWEKLRYS